MRSQVAAVAPMGVYNRRKCFEEQELAVSLFGGLRQVQAAVSYYVQWVAADEYGWSGRRQPHVRLRGVHCLRTGRLLHVGGAQEQQLAEQVEALLFEQGQP